MSTQTISLSLVSLGTQDAPASFLETLHQYGYRVDDFSSGLWRNQIQNQQAPDVLYINRLDDHASNLKQFVEDFGCFNCVVVLSNHADKHDTLLQQFGGVFCWPEDKSRLLADLNARLSGQDLKSKHRLLREEFVKLNLIGSSPVFIEVLSKLKKYSKNDAPVLIHGETGTGKEMAARAIHYLGERSDYPFIPVDCGAIPDSLVENELFGHERGAYTDARQSQHGLITQANGGTLFLDEIDALSSKAQVTLLRFLQTREYRSLGSQSTKKADIRIIAATNADLKTMVAQENFRQDLLFRIDVLSLLLPPLRQRAGDIELLAKYFIRSFCRRYNKDEQQLHEKTLLWMQQHRWPGNVRELENFIHREFLLNEDDVIKPDDLLFEAQEGRRSLFDRRQEISLDIPFSEAKSKMIQEFERNYLRLLMRQTGGNVTRAAKISGKERRALGKLLKKHGIDKNEFDIP